MKLFLASAVAVLAFGSTVRADEMDRDSKAKAAPVAVTAPVGTGSELDQESPDQSHGWRYRRGWGVGVGFYPSYGYSSYYPTYSYSSYYPSYGYSSFYSPSISIGYSSGYFGGGYYGGYRGGYYSGYRGGYSGGYHHHH